MEHFPPTIPLHLLQITILGVVRNGSNPVVVCTRRAVPGTISPNSIPEEQLDGLSALLQSVGARLIRPHGKDLP